MNTSGQGLSRISWYIQVKEAQPVSAFSPGGWLKLETVTLSLLQNLTVILTATHYSGYHLGIKKYGLLMLLVLFSWCTNHSHPVTLKGPGNQSVAWNIPIFSSGWQAQLVHEAFHLLGVNTSIIPAGFLNVPREKLYWKNQMGFPLPAASDSVILKKGPWNILVEAVNKV